MDLQELKAIVAKGEDGWHQFKEDVRSGDSLAAEIVAFSNSEGGRIFIGVSNQGILKGLSRIDIDRVNQLISNAANQQVRSPVSVQTENIALGNHRIVIVVTVSEGIDKPYFDNQGVIWLKNGSDKRRVNSKEELRRLFQEVDLIHADEVPTKARVEVLNFKLLSEFLKKFYHEKLPKSNLNRIQFLENLNLVNGNNLNLAGLLLFGQKPHLYKPQFIIKAIYFPGTKIGNKYLDSEDFEGPLQTIFQGALAFIMRNLRKVQGQKGVNSLGEPEIPQSVFEELLVNALIHRDYFISAPIRLFIFEDRIEIISPGNLPDHLTIEKIQAGNSVQRNPILTSFIAKGLLPYRGLGTGIRRAIEDWPKIKFVDDRNGCLFTAIVERVYQRIDLINDPKNEPINDPINEMQRRILEILMAKPQISYEEIAGELGKAHVTVKRTIQQLKLLKLLRRVGSKKKGFWEVPIRRNDPKNEPINDPINEPINAMQRRILEVLRAKPECSYEQAAVILGKSGVTIKRNIQQLKLLKLLRRIGSNKRGRWEIVEND